MNNLIPHIVGYLFALLVGHCCVSCLVNRLWLSIGEPKKRRAGWWLPKIIGHVERTLYVATFTNGAPEFVAVWIALKVAGQWKVWQNGLEFPCEKVKLSGHAIFNIFVIGNGVSIAFAMGGALFIKNGKGGLGESFAAAGALLVGSLVLWMMAAYYKDKPSEGK